MYLRQTMYQMSVRLKSIIWVFHKAHVENLVAMIVGIVYARSVSLPKIAQHAPIKQIQLESRVQRFERLLECGKFVPLELLKPIASRVLRFVSRKSEPLMILMDRSMIRDTLNLLHVAVAFGGRALPLGWVRVAHEGTSDLKLQKELLTWLKDCLPRGVEVFIVADREFHSIHLAQWIETEMGCHFVLRNKVNTWIELGGEWKKALSLAVKGGRRFYCNVRVTRDPKATHRVNLATVWSVTESEPWLLISDVADPSLIESIYAKRFWIEEMFSDHKSRGLNLEATRITDSTRLQRLLVALVIAYLWIMEVGALVVTKDLWRQVDNRGARRSVSLCQIGLRWLTELFHQGSVPHLLTCRFDPIVEALKT